MAPACQVSRRLERQVPAAWLWQGRHVHLADGFVVTMPDTAPNQQAYPQPASQKVGLGFPQMRLVLIVSLVTACVQGLAYGPCQGKETGETALFRSLMADLVAGDVVVFDRYYCSYFLLALLRRQGQDVVVRLHQRRASDFRRGQCLGPGDHVVTWPRPQRPEWMSVEEYERIPDTITVRELLVEVKEPGFRVDKLVVVTTLLDPTCYAKEDIGDLYRKRWQVESLFKLLKSAGHQVEHWQQETGEAIAKRLLVAAMACALVWRIQRQPSAAGAALRTLLVQLSGRQQKWGQEATAPALLDGPWVLLSMLQALEQHSVEDLRRFKELALAITEDDSG